MYAPMTQRGIFGAPSLEDVRGPLDPGMSLPYDPRMATGAIPDQPFPGMTTPLGVSAAPDPAVEASMGGVPQVSRVDPASINPSIRKPYAFEPGGMGRNIIGSIADALSTWSGGQADFAQGQLLKKRQAMLQAEADRQRAAEYADWTHKQEYEAAHPKADAPGPDEELLIAAGLTPGTPEYQAAAKSLFDRKSDPYVATPLPNGRYYAGPQSGLPTAIGGGTAAVATPPSPGEVRKGYRFKGGNVNDPNAWEPVSGGATPSASGTFQPSVSALWPHLNARESSGNYAAVGPATPYGRAYGGNQLQPGTAKDMAAKLNLPWRPDLLTDTSSTGRNYQDALGQAYLQEGYDKTGNWRDALRYYHGGPDKRLWGKKTNNYADSILRSAGGY